MFPKGGGGVKELLRRKKLTDQRRQETNARAVVMDAIKRIAGSGAAELKPLANGDIELRFRSGEVFHLGELVITRIG